MAEPLDFETMLSARLEARAAMASRPFDPVAIATAAVATRPVRRLALRWPTGAMRWALLGGAAILAALAGALLAATLLHDDDRGQLLALAWSDGVYLAHADGTEPHLLFTSDTVTELAWSTDGTLLLVMDSVPMGNECCVGRATILRTDGSVAWTVEGPTTGGAAWSHRGHRIAALDFDGVVVTDLDTGGTRRLADMPPAVDGAARVLYSGWGSLDWSPDDMRIATTGSVQSDAGGNVVVIVPVDGGSPVQLTSSTGPDMQMPTWSPDGQSIAVLRTATICAADEAACDPSVVAILDATTGRETDSGGTMPFPFQWSPDGSRIAWTGSTSPTEASVFVDRLPLSDGDPAQLDAQWLAGWTPDGRNLLVVRPGPSSPAGLAFDLWQMDSDGSDAVLLVRGATDGALQPTVPAATPPRLAISTPDGVSIADADGSNRDVLVPAEYPARVDWSADGELLLVADFDRVGGHAKVVREDGSEVWNQSAVSGGWFAPEAAWSHLGHRIAWRPGGGVIVTDLDTGAKNLLDTGYAAWTNIIWSPDDRWIAGAEFHEGVGPVLMVAPSDGSAPAHSLPESATKVISTAAWSPDGTSIAVVTIPCAAETDDYYQCPWNLEILDATSGRRIDGIDSVGQGRPLWSPDGSRLAWEGPDETGKATTIFVGTLPLEQNGAHPFLPIDMHRVPVAWTPDGTALLIQQDDAPHRQAWGGTGLWRIDADGTNPVLLVENASDGELQPNR